jgi:hypothetical protein
MLDAPPFWNLGATLPSLFEGRTLHRWALSALDRGDLALALRLFDRAALRYRAELRVQELARLRVHELIARSRTIDGRSDHDLSLEIERRLAGLDTIESLAPPFTRMDARRLLAEWVDPPRTDPFPGEMRVRAA